MYREMCVKWFLVGINSGLTSNSSVPSNPKDSIGRILFLLVILVANTRLFSLGNLIMKLIKSSFLSWGHLMAILLMSMMAILNQRLFTIAIFIFSFVSKYPNIWHIISTGRSSIRRQLSSSWNLELKEPMILSSKYGLLSTANLESLNRFVSRFNLTRKFSFPELIDQYNRTCCAEL